MRNVYHSGLILMLAVVGACAPLPSTTARSAPKQLFLKDYVYDQYIKTVQLFPDFGSPESSLLPAVTPLGQANLLLQFDDLNERQETYNVRLIHCTKDWTKSDLMDLDFLFEYNEYPINQYAFSVDTQIAYVRYQFRVPQVRLSGNYVLAVYRGTDRDDVLLTRRFMVFENQLTMKRNGSFIGAGQLADLNQQINFTVRYENLEILNPMQDVYVTIRQNARWDNLMQNLKPAFVREDLHELEYRFFDPDQLMKGGNEFRFFDLRSVLYPGQNVGTIDRNTVPPTVYVAQDKSREHDAYAQYEDLNGQYLIGNRDAGGVLSAQYVTVRFSLKSAPVQGDVFLTGAFNHWNKDDESRLRYDSASGSYQGSMLLKQGWYDYLYTVESKSLPPWYFEGSHFETENMYEIFVYLRRPFQPRADLLIGYFKAQENPR